MKKILLQVVLTAAVSFAVVFAYSFFNKPVKIGFVRSGIIIRDYKAMNEASEKFDSEIKVVQTNLDTLKDRCDRLNEQIMQTKDPAAKKDLTYQLQISANDFENYRKRSEEEMDQRKSELGQSVLKEINDYIQQYGEKNGYTYILGTTNEGSVLFGKTENDLTDTILADLNNKHSLAKGK